MQSRSIRRFTGHTVESNSVSGPFIQKTATMPKRRRDFRQSGSKNIEFRTQRLSA
jgi:hypothetical protein